MGRRRAYRVNRCSAELGIYRLAAIATCRAADMVDCFSLRALANLVEKSGAKLKAIVSRPQGKGHSSSRISLMHIRNSQTRKYAAAAFCLFIAASNASAADIKCLFPLAFRSSLDELVPKFEESTGNKVTIDYGTIGALTARLRKGEIADVAIVSDKQFNELQQEGKLVADTRVDVAKLGDGVFVRKGAPKSDISSVEAFKRALMEAKAIAYLDPASGAPSGIYIAKLLERLGIAAQMTPKTRLLLTGKSLFDAVVNGDADIGFIQITELLAEPRVELLGPLPLAIQDYTNYAAGIVTTSQHPDLGKALIGFITSPSARAVMKTRGFEAR
jgi:molybdate transport system substrate-binding protein